jgi:dimethylhistidine N-methyltransferase
MFDAALLDDDITGDVLAGLRSMPKTLPPKLFYDVRGVALFDAITRLPEYYLTRTERALLERISPEIVALAEPGSVLVEYGACDEGKAVMLLDREPRAFGAYVPVDVARAALEAVTARMAISHPWLDVYPVCGDFMRGLGLPDAVRGRPAMGFFPGSTIGNLDPDAAVGFLDMVRGSLGAGSWLIVGADLRKSPDVLIPAYDDAEGVTAAFNMNVLERLNREAGGGFDLTAFRHVAVWNAAASRIEMHLESLVDQVVPVAGSAIRFAAGETIHTENSYKHSLAALRDLARRAGWETVRSWTDADDLFGVHALRATGG